MYTYIKDEFLNNRAGLKQHARCIICDIPGFDGEAVEGSQRLGNMLPKCLASRCKRPNDFPSFWILYREKIKNCKLDEEKYDKRVTKAPKAPSSNNSNSGTCNWMRWWKSSSTSSSSWRKWSIHCRRILLRTIPTQALRDWGFLFMASRKYAMPWKYSFWTVSSPSNTYVSASLGLDNSKN